MPDREYLPGEPRPLVELRREFDAWQSGEHLQKFDPPRKPLPYRLSDALTVGVALVVAVMAAGFYDLSAISPSHSHLAYAAVFIGMPWLWWAAASWISARIAHRTRLAWLAAAGLLLAHAVLGSLAIMVMALRFMGRL